MTVTDTDMYITDDASGGHWTMWLGDSCERITEMKDDSVDLIVCSPPFASLYVYSPSPRDLGNAETRAEFHEQYAYIIRETLRVLKPGRLAAIHVQQLTTTKAVHGHVGLTDFRGEVIKNHVDNGWWFIGETTIWKNPQSQATRTKATSLMFVTKNRDSLQSRPALADYLLLFRKPGEADVQVKTDVTNEEWIEFASPVWWDIRETDTLNTAVAKADKDERHIAPLQLGLIDRAVRLWTNPGELVFSPFGGIGSEGYQAIKRGRRFHGVELKPEYWKVACRNLREAEATTYGQSLFDDVTDDPAAE